jgi:sugar/nucleoside kinase (ribokinase family)
MRTLCLGEALVDLVCERPVEALAEADAFVPHSGGAVANAAVVAARCGAAVALGGGVGGDAWGEWLEQRMRSEGLDLSWFARVPGVATPLAFVTVNDTGEPQFVVYGETIPKTMKSIEADLEAAVTSCNALFFGSNTLVGESEQQLTMTARKLALDAGKPILFDPNLRLARWPDRAQALEVVRAACGDSLLVKVNRAEATQLNGEDEPERAADAICALGAKVALITLGTDGALARGAVHCAVGGFPVKPIDTTGAGDVVAGVLIAALAAQDFDPAAVTGALPLAIEAASRSTEGWGAIDSLPDPMPVPA